MNDHSMIDPLEQAIKLQNSGAVDEAKLIFLRLLANDQKNIAALYSLAVLHFNKGEAETALPYIDQAISLKPEIEYFYSTKKAILNLMGSYEAAYLLKIPGKDSDGSHNMLEAQSLLKEITGNPASIFINKNAVSSLSNLVAACETYTKNGQFEKAILLYRHYINSKAPDAFLAKYNLGALYSTLNEHHFSAACYEEITKSYPVFIPAHMNLGTVYERLGRNKDALAAWEKALALPQIDASENKEEKIKLLNNLGRLNEIDRSYEKAEHYLHESLKEDPSQSAPLQHWFHLRQKQFKWPLLTDNEFCQKPIEEIMSPLASLAYTNDPALQRACAERFVKEKVKIRERRVPKHHRYNHDKIRIAYASSDLSTHAVSLLTVELIELHDREKFEVYAFCWSPEDGTSFRQRVKSAFDHFHPIGHLSDDEAADLIQSLEIDVLVDLQGLSGRARPNLIAQGAAPIQIAYLGYPGTTCLPNVDYVVADKFVFPEELKPHFSEEPLYLDTVFQVSDSKRKIGTKKSRSFYGLPEDKFVFCSFNNAYKYTPEVISAWSEILNQCPDSILWLLEDNDWSKANLLVEFKKNSIDTDRIFFASRVLPEDYLARFKCADLFLDTFPYNAGTTANDALFAGLPVLTLAGKTYVSRMAGALLAALAQPNLIAVSSIGYITIAVNLYHQHRDIKISSLLSDKNRFQIFSIINIVKNFEAKISQLYI